MLRAAAITILVGTSVGGAGTVVYHAVRLHAGPDARLVRGPFELKADQIEEMDLLDQYVPETAPTLSDNAALLHALTGRPMYPTIALADPQATEAQFDRWGIRYASLGKRWMRDGHLGFASRPWPVVVRTKRVLILKRPMVKE